MSSAQVIVGELIPLEIPFDIDEIRWETLPDNNKHYLIKISKAIIKVSSKLKVSSEYSSLTDCIYFNFSSKNKVYHNLKKSLETYNSTREKKYNNEYILLVKL